MNSHNRLIEAAFNSRTGFLGVIRHLGKGQYTETEVL
jgi:hypothetical protein